ncbi:MAG: response regulator [Nostoc sp. SerVER01]|uniref:response regulator n=1 Tax=Nostoc sp. CCY 9925 TaxID=3103865 RepID=UPI002AD97E66|nr:response regulator [Nostoc sp. SerVER01]MDZ8029299.1 response regulator [Nostoc sp. DedQUE11]MDZ8083341.1 response regulator [Nostoc sp. DcaGUA01]MDZ8236219.1 response regulator [Nostoc sp. ChiQUE01a]
MALVLIIDDAAFSRRMIRKYLQVDGYQILEATNGREGLEMVHNHQPNCVLADLLMPDMNGFEFLEAMQAEELKIPTIIISADIQEGSRNQSYNLGAVNFINKPVKENELRKAVQEVINRKE